MDDALAATVARQVALGDSATALIFIGLAVAVDALYGFRFVLEPTLGNAIAAVAFGLCPTALLSWVIVASLFPDYADNDRCTC